MGNTTLDPRIGVHQRRLSHAILGFGTTQRSRKSDHFPAPAHVRAARTLLQVSDRFSSSWRLTIWPDGHGRTVIGQRRHEGLVASFLANDDTRQVAIVGIATDRENGARLWREMHVEARVPMVKRSAGSYRLQLLAPPEPPWIAAHVFDRDDATLEWFIYMTIALGWEWLDGVKAESGPSVGVSTNPR